MDYAPNNPPEVVSTYTVITIRFDGKYWEGGNFDALTGHAVYNRFKKDPAVFKVELIRYTPGIQWKLIAFHNKPIPKEWEKQRGIEP